MTDKDDFTAKQDGIYSKILKKFTAWAETKRETTNYILLMIFFFGFAVGIIAVWL